MKDIRDFLNVLETIGMLKRVKTEVSPILEIPEILRRVMYKKGPAILFENVKGYKNWKVVGNLFYSIEALKIAFNVKKLEEIGYRMVNLMVAQPPMDFIDKIKTLKEVISLGKFLPKKIRKAPFFERVVDNPSLLDLPAFKTWPKDGGRYLTFPVVISRDPETGVVNMGVYRVMILDEKRGVIHWQIHKRGAEAYRRAFETDLKRIPIAIAISCEPAVLFTGISPVPYPIDKLLFAGIVKGESIEVVKLDSGLIVPANAEVLLEGYIKIDDLSEEGPFGDHFGYYDKPTDRYPVFHLERIYMRENPIYYGTVVGKPALEDAVLGKAVERVFLPIVRVLFPEIVEMNLPEYGMFQGIAIVSIKKRYPGHAKKVMMGLWGIGQLSLTKIIIVVDSDVNPHNLNEVLWAIAANVDPQRDVVVVPGTHTDALDPATPIQAYGSKLGIDATKKFPEEYGYKSWPEEVEVDEEISKLVDEKWSSYGID